MNATEIGKATEGQKLTIEELMQFVNQMDDGVVISVQLNERGELDGRV